MPPRVLHTPITYSPAVTISLTHDCPWHCTYCGFRADQDGLISELEIERQLALAQREGAREILFIAGEIPDSQPHLRAELARRGYRTFIDFACDLGRRALERGFFPHTNLGALSAAQLARLREVNFSMGLMLENIDDAFNRAIAPQKTAASRLRTIEEAGRLRIPYTSGILVGLGESPDSRRESLRALAELHRRFGHLQEIILQNYIPNTGSTAAAHPLAYEEYLSLIEYWFELAPGVAVQIPPNINPHWVRLLPFIHDLGGISPETDVVNPNHPWARVEAYRRAALEAGRTLEVRLPVYPQYLNDHWLDRRLVHKIPRPRRPARSLWDQPTAELWAAATELTQSLHGSTVTYVVNRNANFTNICHVGCSFCGFQRRAGDSDAYDRTAEEIIARLEESPEITEVCLQGGIHPGYQLDDYLGLIRALRHWRADVHLHAFSPMEIFAMSRRAGMNCEQVLERLVEAGLNSIPGTAAEILVDNVRQDIASRKLQAADWIHIVRTAHRLGLRSTATLMYGHVETWEHIRQHLEILLRIQEETGGFTEFIPLQFMPWENPLGHRIRPDPVAVEQTRLRLYPLARLFFGKTLPHLQTSWVKLGVEEASELLAVCDDFGGTLYEESITRSSGGSHGEYLSATQIETAIRAVGKVPRQRTTLYGTPQPCRPGRRPELQTNCSP